MRLAVLCLMLLGSVVPAGCQRPVAVPPAVQPPAAEASDDSPPGSAEAPSGEDQAVQGNTSSVPPLADSTGSEEAADASAPQSAEAQETEPIAAASDAAATEVAAAEQLPRERFLLLTRDGPMVIDVVLRINDEPYTRALQRLVERVMSELGGEAAEASSWTALLDNPAFAYGQFGNLTPADSDQQRQLVEMYDTNRNGLVDREELPRFLTRNAGGSQSFSLRSSNEFRGENRTRSPTRLLLDRDHNGAISTDEMQVASQRMFERDVDDDEILVLADFKDSVEPLQPEMSNQRRVNVPDTAIAIDERTRWGYVSYALQETYAYGERVQADDIPLSPELVALLDKNENSLIDKQEVPQLAEVPPHLVLDVCFWDPAGATQAMTPSIRILSASDSLSDLLDVARQHPTRVSFDLPGANIEFFVREDPSLANTAATITAQFTLLDADKNGYLSADEYSGQILGMSIPFEAIDTNADGMVYESDVGALLEQRQAVVRAQIRARAADQEDALFRALDTNGDGRLTAREVYGAPRVLQDLDRNEDGQLQSHEIPGTMAVGFVRGDAQQDNALFVMPPLEAANAGERPAWFIGMDANDDGDISPREFLGPAAKFEQLDADGDGFVSAAEARQAGG